MLKEIYEKCARLFGRRKSNREAAYGILAGTAPKKEQDEFWMRVMKKANAEQRKIVEAADKLAHDKAS